ncbi:DUF3231 family protein [Lentibacillus sp. N15]|uniref:DUF3231 family protein n=1 Tax=Lentibacillus songyuanensis TaxID=3136161 RepID=UPI0031B9ACF9
MDKSPKQGEAILSLNRREGLNLPSIGSMFKNAVSVIESLTDNHKNPLHVGETMACWTYLNFVSGIIGYMEVAIHMTTDSELKKQLQNALQVPLSHKKELSQFMRKEGVSLPDMPEHKPESNPNDVPLGAKLTDNEIANTININFVVAADMCAGAASQSLRTDVAIMFLRYQIDKLSLGLKFKDLMQQKGWLKIPPFYHPPGSLYKIKVKKG